MYLKLQPNLEAVFVCNGPTHEEPVTFDFVELTVVAETHGWQIGIQDENGKPVDRCRRCGVQMAREALGHEQEKLSHLDQDDESNQPIIDEIKKGIALANTYLDQFDPDRKTPKKDDRQPELPLGEQAALDDKEEQGEDEGNFAVGDEAEFERHRPFEGAIEI